MGATEMPMPEDADMPLITTMMPDGAAPMMPTSRPIGSATVEAAAPTCSSLSSASASSFSGQNVAARDLGTVPFGSSSLLCSSLAGGKGITDTGIHCWANINDGLLGNAHSWVAAHYQNGPHFVGVAFAEPKDIAGFRISRNGDGSCCDDRIDGSYTVQYTLASDADEKTPDSSWTSLGTFSRSTIGFEYFSFCREIRAAAVRIVVTSFPDLTAPCIDELEIYEAAAPTCSSLSSASASSFSG